MRGGEGRGLTEWPELCLRRRRGHDHRSRGRGGRHCHGYRRRAADEPHRAPPAPLHDGPDGGSRRVLRPAGVVRHRRRDRRRIQRPQKAPIRPVLPRPPPLPLPISSPSNRHRRRWRGRRSSRRRLRARRRRRRRRRLRCWLRSISRSWRSLRCRHRGLFAKHYLAPGRAVTIRVWRSAPSLLTSAITKLKAWTHLEFRLPILNSEPKPRACKPEKPVKPSGEFRRAGRVPARNSRTQAQGGRGKGGGEEIGKYSDEIKGIDWF